MKSSFILRLPIDEAELAGAEEYTRGVVYADLQASPGEHAHRIMLRDAEGAAQTCVKHRLRDWLDDGLQALLRGAFLQFNLYETRYPDHCAHQALFCRSFPALSVYVLRRVAREPPGYYTARAARVDVLAESTPLLSALGPQLGARLEEALDDGAAGVELLFDLYIDSGYELANEYIHGLLVHSFRLHLVYFYKSLLLFRPRWSRGQPPPARLEASRAPRGDTFVHVVRNYEELKLFTGFLAAAPRLPTLPAEARCPPRVFREGALRKRGDGPIDFTWRERYFVLFADRLAYLRAADAAEERGHVELRGMLLGEVGAFDGMAHALLIEHAHAQKKLWVAAATREELLDWRRRVAELLLGCGGEEPLTGEENLFSLQYAARRGRGSRPELAAAPGPRAPADAQLVERCAELRALAGCEDRWLYYAMRMGVKVRALRGELGPRRDARAAAPALAAAGLAAAWVCGAPLRLSALLLVALLAGALLWLWRGGARVTLCGALTVERAPQAVLDFVGCPQNLQAWDTTFQRVELKTLTRFQASYRVAPQRHARLLGRLGVDGDALLLEFGDAGCRGRAVLRAEPVAGAPHLARLALAVQTARPAPRAQLVAESEERVAALALIEGEMADREKRASREDVRLGVVEDQELYREGAPSYDLPVTALAAERQLILALRDQRPLSAAARATLRPAAEELQPAGSCADRRFLLDALFEPLFFRRPDLALRHLPLRFFGTTSLFEALAEALSFCPAYLALAAAEPAADERMRLCLAALLGGLSTLARFDRLPVLPQSGETFQGFWPDGTALDFEQLDAETTAFAVESGRQEFCVTGRLRLQCDLVGNAVRVRPLGSIRVCVARGEAPAATLTELLAAGDCFDFTCPPLLFIGCFFGPRALSLEGEGRLRAVGSAAACDFALGQLTLRYRGLRCARLEALPGTTDSLQPSGEWPLCVAFGARQYWQADLLPPLALAPAARCLPSDIRRREARYFRARNMEPQAAAAHFEESKQQYFLDIFRRRAR